MRPGGSGGRGGVVMGRFFKVKGYLYVGSKLLASCQHRVASFPFEHTRTDAVDPQMLGTETLRLRAALGGWVVKRKEDALSKFIFPQIQENLCCFMALAICQTFVQFFQSAYVSKVCLRSSDLHGLQSAFHIQIFGIKH